MIDKIVEATEEETKEISDDDYNAIPPGFKEITEKEFAQSSFFIYCLSYYETRQITELPKKMKEKFGEGCLEVRMFYMNNKTGWAMAHDYWKGKVYYFQFGCDHDMELVKNLGKCYNQYKCKKCGHTQNIDSSD